MWEETEVGCQGVKEPGAVIGTTSYQGRFPHAWVRDSSGAEYSPKEHGVLPVWHLSSH